MNILVLILVVVILLGGGGYYYGGPALGGLLGFALVVSASSFGSRRECEG